ncbi:Putative secreted glycosyl hydrolase [Fulvivirga imtechensis AK7]|uniref:Putative secreted glycosyl hydrolase n=1 Tax=Fulvivirga imtechensis AK7 TaxID=1237149 RepID=L8K1T4_9BACT|nr:DUF1080 domain-containing protein [Fulvivirga imtechensis]ELR73417.1 Putative secreted glycosyl hydrolase [Fulvivirga imtechensis AK7]
MKIKSLLFVIAILVSQACGTKSGETEGETTDTNAVDETEAVTEEQTSLNTLSEKEKEDGWMLLFDGESSKGWRGYGKDNFPSDWQVVDGTLYMAASGRGEAGSKNGGDIIYDKKFKNFDLKLEWKVSEGGNSGIFYLGQETDDYDFIWKTAPEMQILDNERHPDAKLGKDGNRQAGSLYDIYPANPQNAKPAGGWNQVEIIVYNGTVVHKQNGETVVEYHLWTPKWNEDVAASKFPGLNENWAEVAQEGYIGLQDHGDDVWFRNIKIKEL